MNKKITKKRVAIAFVIVFGAIQVFRIDKTKPYSDPVHDFLKITQASPEVTTLIKTSCYDCHSSKPKYPWYTNVAPFSWWIQHHINEGREELNFSDWGTYSERRKDHKLKECVEMLEENEMPLSSYTLIHRDASLSPAQKAQLLSYFNSWRTHESDKPKK